MRKSIVFISLFAVVLSCTKGPKKLSLEHQIIGKKSPVIIFENGMASTFETWKQIPDSTSKKATVLLYNRAGLGLSDTAKTKRTIPNMVDDLHALLQEKELKGPYLFVAHSMGSYLSRYFALKHPEKVSGILLVDPSPDTMYDVYTEKETQDFLAFGNENFKNSSKGAKDEWNNYLDNRKFVQKLISNDIPMTILSATQWDFYQYHESILNKHPNSKHLKIEGSHDLHHDRPDVIIQEINRLIELIHPSE